MEGYTRVKSQSTESNNVTITLGGVNQATGEKNATRIEGYYVNKKTVTKKDGGLATIYVFKTDKGEVGVWGGKKSLDDEMRACLFGKKTLVVCTGTKPLPGGKRMYLFEVGQKDNDTLDDDSYEAISDDPLEEEGALDEVPFEAPKAPSTPAPANKSRAEALARSRTKNA